MNWSCIPTPITLAAVTLGSLLSSYFLDMEIGDVSSRKVIKHGGLLERGFCRELCSSQRLQCTWIFLVTVCFVSLGGAFFHSLDNLKRALYILVLKHLLSWVSRISQLAIGLCDVRQIPKARYRCKHYFAHRWTLACKWPVDVTFRESWSVGWIAAMSKM